MNQMNHWRLRFSSETDNVCLTNVCIIIIICDVSDSYQSHTSQMHTSLLHLTLQAHESLVQVEDHL